MKKKAWIILLLLGICPFMISPASYLYQMLLSTSLSMLDWVILYSYLYWPSYVVGLILIILALYQRNRSNSK